MTPAGRMTCRPPLSEAEEQRLAALLKEDPSAGSSGSSSSSRSSSNFVRPSPAAANDGAEAAVEAAIAQAEAVRRWAEDSLAADGELVEGKHTHPELLLLAHAILVAAPGRQPS